MHGSLEEYEVFYSDMTLIEGKIVTDNMPKKQAVLGRINVDLLSTLHENGDISE